MNMAMVMSGLICALCVCAAAFMVWTGHPWFAVLFIICVGEVKTSVKEED